MDITQAMMQLKDVREFSENANSSKIRTLKQLQSTMDLSWTKKKDYRIINTIESLKECITEMNKAPLIGVDTEATGLNFYNLPYNSPQRDIIVGLCISWKRHQGIYIPFEHIKFPNIDKGEALRLLQPVLETKPCAVTNGIFDGKVLYSEGIMLNIKHDTIQLLFNIDSDEFRFARGLKSCVRYFYDYTPIEFEDIFEFEKDYKLFKYVDEDVVKYYACADCDHTLSLIYDLLPKLNKKHYRGYLRDMELMPHLMRSEYMGKAINMELLRKLSDINKTDLARVEELIYTYVGRSLVMLSSKDSNVDKGYYRFNINSVPELRALLIDKLGYPGKEGHGIDKSILKWWANEKTNDVSLISKKLIPDDFMSDSINYPELNLKAKQHTLLSKKEIYNCKYPLSLLIQLYRHLAKNQSSFFDPLLSGVTDGRFYSGIKMARAATFRLIDVIQTLDSKLKGVVAAQNGYYQIGYDYSQIEARVMIGLSKYKPYVKMLSNPENDYHTESAAVIEGVSPKNVTKKTRKLYKPINFGIPYGIGPQNMTEQRVGIGLSKDAFKIAVEQTKSAIAKWKIGMKPIWDMLQNYRRDAIEPLENSEKPFHMIGTPTGAVYSPYGRARYYDLSNITDAKIARIQRQSGNFPIQSYARDIYVEGIINLGNKLKSEGLMDVKVEDDYSAIGYHFENKVNFMAYIHDEVQMEVTEDISAKWMMKQIYDKCVIYIPNHPPYYIGSGIVKSWGESKDGDHDVPIQWLIDLPDDLPKYEMFTEHTQSDVDKECAEYIKTRVIADWEKQGIDILTCEAISKEDMDKFESYYLMDKMTGYFFNPKKYPVKDFDDVNDVFVSSLSNAFEHLIVYTDSKEPEKNETKESLEEINTDYNFDWNTFWDDFGDESHTSEEYDDDSDSIGKEIKKEGSQLETNLFVLDSFFAGL